MRIEVIDGQAAPEAELRAAYDIVAANERDALPDWEPTPWEAFLGSARAPLVWRPTTRWVARDDAGVVVGTSALAVERRSTNRDHADIEVDVHPAARRRGVGRALARAAAERGAAEGCTMLDAMGRDHPSVLAFAEALGFAPKLRERRSGVRFDGLDAALLDTWTVPVPGYDLVTWDDHYPAEWLERLAAAAGVMNTAPLDDFEMEPEVITAHELDELQATRSERGIDWTTMAAVHAATGEVAGYTEVHFHPGRAVGEQEDTGVWPEHRNQGLGRWLKAAMLLHIMEARPSVRAVETWNAGSNDAMLHINVELGFEVLEWWWNLQGSTEVVLGRTA